MPTHLTVKEAFGFLTIGDHLSYLTNIFGGSANELYRIYSVCGVIVTDQYHQWCLHNVPGDINSFIMSIPLTFHVACIYINAFV